MSNAFNSNLSNVYSCTGNNKNTNICFYLSIFLVVIDSKGYIQNTRNKEGQGERQDLRSFLFLVLS